MKVDWIQDLGQDLCFYRKRKEQGEGEGGRMGGQEGEREEGREGEEERVEEGGGVRVFKDRQIDMEIEGGGRYVIIKIKIEW